jgi:hypothetical protein
MSPVAVRRVIFTAAALIVLVAGAVVFYQPARSVGAPRTIEGIGSTDALNTFSPGGEVHAETRPARIFVVRKGEGDAVIEGFDAANNDKLRIEGYSLTRPQAVKAIMRQAGRDTVLSLPGGPTVRLVNVTPDAIPDSSLQLELDRTGLVETFKDDFNSFSWYAEGLAPDKDRLGTWRTHYGWQAPGGEGSRSLPGESEVYADPAFKGTAGQALGLNPFHLVDGTLEIWGEPAPERILPFIWGRRYVSGLITTKYSFSQLYGVFEIRARLPKGRGFWPAFWLLPADSTWPPEIDVFEVLGHETTKLYVAAHSKAGGDHTAAGGDMRVPDLSEDFHRYAVEWGPEEIRWYFDGVEIERVATPADMHKPMYMLANLAVGGGWPGQPDGFTTFPGVYAIDFIRAYRREPKDPPSGEKHPS